MHRVVVIAVVVACSFGVGRAAVPLRCPTCTSDTDCSAYGSPGTCIEGRCSNAGANCCSTLYDQNAGVTPRTCSAEVGSPVPPTRRNILFVLADDIGYCHHGFMITKGACATSGHLCTSPADCSSGEACDFELTCRNRQPGIGKDSGSFPYERSDWSSVSIPVLTPFIDDLAAHGAVFTRAHVAASTCTSSRQTFLTGRYQRHLSYLKTEGDTKFECVQSDTNRMSTSPPAACSVVDTTCSTGGKCGTVRTIPTLLHEFTLGDYEALASGKTEFFNVNDGFDAMPQHRKKPGVGKFRCNKECGSTKTCGDNCPECDACRAELGLNRIPDEARDSLREVTSFIEDNTISTTPVTSTTLPPSAPPPGSFQTHPFFIWYAPNIPHKGSTADLYFRDLYKVGPYAAPSPTALHKKEQLHFARISWLDFGMRTIADYLQTACVCSQDDDGGAFSWKPLYDTTVVIYAGGDQGFLMPKAKHNATENGHRMVLVVSEPGHRRPTPDPVPRAFPDEFAATPDVLQTVLAYAGITTAVPYAYGRNLKPWVEGDTGGPVRDFQYSEEGASTAPNDGGPHYLVNRPGMIGVCSGGVGGPTGHRRPCIVASDCGTGGTCKMPDQANGRRCVNQPAVACSVDADCATAAMCSGGHCGYVSGISYKDMEGTPCTSGGVECVPSGVCRPLMLKAEANPGGVVDQLWDVNWTPDQLKTDNLFKLSGAADPDYLGKCLRAEMQQCLYRFRAYEPHAAQYPAPPISGLPADCPTTHWCP